MGTLDQFNFTRVYTLGRLKSVSDDKWDIQPNGVNNTIRWNVGHIYTTLESLIHRGVPTYEVQHPEWKAFFAGGTKPADWTEEAPSKEELLSALHEQSSRVHEFLTDKLSEQMSEGMTIGKFHEIVTVEDVILFAIWHEAVHAGIIFSLNKMTAIQE